MTAVAADDQELTRHGPGLEFEEGNHMIHACIQAPGFRKLVRYN